MMTAKFLLCLQTNRTTTSKGFPKRFKMCGWVLLMFLFLLSLESSSFIGLTAAEIDVHATTLPVVYACLTETDLTLPRTPLSDSTATNAAACLYGLPDHHKSRSPLDLRGGEVAENETTRLNAPLDYSRSKYAFPLYQEGDGSDEDIDGIPRRYLAMQGDNRERAKKAFENTLQWREENDINTILARPNPKFDVCKTVFPHYFCGRDDTNHVILLQRPGLINLDLAKLNELTGDDLLYHYVFEMEYLWRIEEPHVNGTMTSIIDLTGINLSLLTKREIVNVIKLFCTTMDAHFPQRSFKTLIINAPKWFGSVYRIVSPLLRESTKAKIAVFSSGKEQETALSSLLSQCGNYDEKSGDVEPSEMEQDLRDFCVARLEESDMIMQPVIT